MLRIGSSLSQRFDCHKQKHSIDAITKALEAEKLRIQKRRESDAKCRANLANCYHKLRSRLPKTVNVQTRKPLSKEMVLHGTVQYVQYLENLVLFLSDEKVSFEESSSDTKLESLQDEFCEEYKMKWENVRIKKTNSKKKTASSEQAHTVPDLASHNICISEIPKDTHLPTIQPRLVNTQYITMATKSDSYSLLVTPSDYIKEEMISVSDQAVTKQTDELNLLCNEETVSKLQDDYFDVEMERTCTPDLCCREDPASSLVAEGDSLVPEMSFATPVKDLSGKPEKSQPILYKKHEKSGHESRYKEREITDRLGSESCSRSTSRKRKLMYIDESDDNDGILSNEQDTEDVYSSDQWSVENDGLRRKVKCQYKKRATAARVRPWNPIIGKVESPVLPYSAFNSSKRHGKKCDSSPSQRTDPDFRLNEYHRRRIESAQKVKTRPLRTSTPKLKLVDHDCEDIDLETETLYESKKHEDQDGANKQNDVPIPVQCHMSQAQINGYTLFYNQVVKQLQKLLPDSDITEEPFPTTIAKMWNDLKYEQQLHLIVTAQTLQEMGKDLDESLPSDIMSQQTEKHMNDVDSFADDYQSHPSSELTSDFDPQFSIFQESTVIDSANPGLWDNPLEEKPVFSLDGDHNKKLQEFNAEGAMVTGDAAEQVAKETADFKPVIPDGAGDHILPGIDAVGQQGIRDAVKLLLGKDIKLEKDDFLPAMAADADDDRQELMNLSNHEFLPLEDTTVQTDADQLCCPDKLYEFPPELANFPVFELQGDVLVQKEQKTDDDAESLKTLSDSKIIEDYIMSYVDDAVVDMVLEVEEDERLKLRKAGYSPMLSGNSDMNLVPTFNVSNQSLDSVWDDLQVVPDICDDGIPDNRPSLSNQRFKYRSHGKQSPDLLFF